VSEIQLRIHGSPERPTLIYLPGLHGDWTLVSSFREAVKDELRFVEFAYPCRCDWRLPDYARHVVEALASENITSGWLLGESFSSQVTWALLELQAGRNVPFTPQGIILAGGFVKYPVAAGVHSFHALHRAMPWWLFRALLRFYATYARLRHRQAPETLASIGEFVARRTKEDRAAIASRYPLIAGSDFRATARATPLPIYALTGFFDPIVPWPGVLPWLRRNCPTFRGSRIIFNADHNVLGTAPAKSAQQILAWMRETERAAVDSTW
jgi:pimeloyl-ACP methyl ester carboxylesterase